MVTESSLSVVEIRAGTKWHSSKDLAAFGSPLKRSIFGESGMIRKEHDFHRHQEGLVPSRSGSAPPSMEGSFASIRHHLIDEKFGSNSSLDDLRNILKNSESAEQLPSDPENIAYCFSDMDLNHHLVERISRSTSNRVLTSTGDRDHGPSHLSQGSVSSQKDETEEDSPTLEASQEFAESSVAPTPEKSNISSASRQKSLVDLIQEDFPRTPSTVYNQSRTPEPSSDSSEMTQSGVTLSTSFPSLYHLDETGKPPRDESRANYVNLVYSSTLETPRIDSRANLEIKRNQEKQQSYRKNFPKLRVSEQEDVPYQVHRVPGQSISQGMHQLPGFTPPLYAGASALMGNHLFPNLQLSGLYAPQYSFPGYASGSTFVSPFMAGYSPHSLHPFSSSPGYVGVTADGIPHMGDMRQQSKFYGQHMSMPQPSLGNHLHMQYCPMSPADIFENHFVQPESTFSTYAGDRKYHISPSGSLNVSAPRKMETSGYGNPPFINVTAQFPASSLASPITPSSSVAGGKYRGHPTEMRFPPGLIRNPGTYSGWQGKNGFNDLDDSKKLSFLEELNSSNAQKLELSKIEGHIVDFSIDQRGSRYIQQKLEQCSAEEKMLVFKEVVPHASRLMVDVFGNYVIQKFLEHGSAEQRKELAEKLSGQMLSLSLQMYGCRVIQKALEVIDLDQKSPLVKELDGHVMKCVHDQNGNHVIQKCIECLPTEEIVFIIYSFQGHVPKLACHPYGCRVIQRVLEHCMDASQCRCIVDEILESACFLSHDQYGNYVIQHIIERGRAQERGQIIDKLAGRVVQMSQHKYASNVVEKCLEYCDSTEQELLIEELLDQSDENDNLLAMMKDQYANYVVQKVFEMSNERQREILLDRTRAHLHALRKYTYGKHIAARFEQV